MRKPLSPDGVAAVLFDLDGTLRHNLPPFNQALLDFAVQLGAPDSAKQRRIVLRWVHYYWAQSPEMLQDLESYHGLSEDFWIYYTGLTLEQFCCPAQQAQTLGPLVHQRMQAEYQPVDHVPAEVWETLTALQAANFPLGVVSNRRNSFIEQLDSLGLTPFFRFTLAAGEVNSWKPEPGIFHHALAQLGTQPEQTIYVGDNYYADILGAVNAGLRPVLLDPDGLFPEAECPVIPTLDGLLDVIRS